MLKELYVILTKRIVRIVTAIQNELRIRVLVTNSAVPIPIYLRPNRRPEIFQTMIFARSNSLGLKCQRFTSSG